VVSGTAGLSAITTTGPMTTGNSDATQLMNESADPFTAQVDDAIPTQRSTDWPSLVSTPLIHNNRFSALATTTDDECSDPSRFEEQRSARIKRRRQLSSQQRQQQYQQRQQQNQQHQREDTLQQSQARRSRAPLVIGKSVASGASVAAAKQIFKKSVFLVDNVAVSHNADDIRSFVSSMAINVISCFEVKPRRRRDEKGVINDRKAFRLCIRADDQDRLLDPSKWPSSIAISKWFFKAPADAASDKRRRLDEVTLAGAAAVGRGSSHSVASAMDQDDEETLPLDTTVVNASTNDGGV